jgi:hypothetical protein
VPIGQEPTAVPPFFDEFMEVDPRGVGVITYEDRDKSVSHHITDDPKIKTESAITFEGSPDCDEWVVVWVTSDTQLCSEIRG